MKKIFIILIISFLIVCSGTSEKKITYHVSARAISSQHGFSKVKVSIAYRDESGKMVSVIHDCRQSGFNKEITVLKEFRYTINAQVQADFPCELDVIVYKGIPFYYGSNKKLASERKQGMKPLIQLAGIF